MPEKIVVVNTSYYTSTTGTNSVKEKGYELKEIPELDKILEDGYSILSITPIIGPNANTAFSNAQLIIHLTKI